MRPAIAFVIAALVFLGGLFFIFFREEAGKKERPVPSSSTEMKLFVATKIANGNKQFEKILQKKYPDFQLLGSVPEDVTRISGTTKFIRFGVEDAENAIASLHDDKTGELLFACNLPCDTKIYPNQDYLVAMNAVGHVPKILGLRRDQHESERFYQFLGGNMIEVAGQIGECWREHEEAGFPDTKTKPCVRMPPDAKRSSHCKVEFDVLPTGWVGNARLVYCTNGGFSDWALSAMDWWYYTPETKDGQFLTSERKRTKITFRLRNEDGVLLDEVGRPILNEDAGF